jgi:hypothetical protein
LVTDWPPSTAKDVAVPRPTVGSAAHAVPVPMSSAPVSMVAVVALTAATVAATMRRRTGDRRFSNVQPSLTDGIGMTWLQGCGRSMTPKTCQ